MSARVRIGAAWVDALPKAYDATGEVLPNTVREFTQGAWRTVWSLLSMEVEPGVASKGGSGFQQTDDVSAVVSGAQGAVTYSWVRTSGDSRISVTNSSAQTVRFNATVSDGETLSAVFTCTATDTGTNASASDTVTVSFIGAVN